MTRGRLVALVAAAAVGAVLAMGARVVLTAPDTALPWSVVGSGGSTNSSSASYRLGATAGQPAIGQADSAGFRLGAGFWYADSDGDGVLDAADNCPSTANAGQEDGDGDSVGTACDNCPTTSNTGQENTDGDQWGDACETADCVAVATLWATPPGDQDCDGFTTTAETFMGTLPLVACAVNDGPNNEGLPDHWPYDFDDNQRAAIADVLGYIPVFNKFYPADPQYDPRYDLNQSNGITVGDVLSYIPVFNKTCVLPP
ncbi:MAG: thrombospondin type 3 repeat-containing protein [Dehalococcoidia bacterium]|nr:thrombospondin type 3 repeat-containing protein [Dehalococcoidia bacterium]